MSDAEPFIGATGLCNRDYSAGAGEFPLQNRQGIASNTLTAKGVRHCTKSDLFRIHV